MTQEQTVTEPANTTETAPLAAVAPAPEAPKNTHILLTVNEAQAIYNYLGTLPYAAVAAYTKALENAPGVTVTPKAEDANQNQAPTA